MKNSIRPNRPKTHFSPFDPNSTNQLLSYFDRLSQETKNRFGPHPFTKEAIQKLYDDHKNYLLFNATETGSDSIIAYTIVKMGWVNFDEKRLNSYGLSPKPTDCTLAPSVADVWQGKGIGSDFLVYLMQYLRANFNIKRIILWGGVQGNNKKAIGFYKKFGFRTLGEFVHNGNNFDMILEL